MVQKDAVTGTHQGEFNGLPPTGRSVAYGEIFIMRFADGRIAEVWGVVDVFPQMKQLGMIQAKSVRHDQGKQIMQAPPGQPTGQALRALLADGTLAGDWVLDARRSSVRLKSRSVWGLAPVNGVFREVSGSGAISKDGSASGTLTVAAASIDTGNIQRDTHLRSADFFDSANHPGNHLHRR